MTTQNTGGPAFPTQESSYEQKYSGEGMTLRDYFAAKAMQAGISGCAARNKAFWCSDMATLAYEMADAMLKARER